MIKHPPASRSVVGFNLDGMELARRRRVRRGFPVRQVVLFALAVVAFKIFLGAGMGISQYNSKMATLAEGNSLEQVAARVMVLDPVSTWAVENILHAAGVVAEIQERNTRTF